MSYYTPQEPEKTRYGMGRPRGLPQANGDASRDFAVGIICFIIGFGITLVAYELTPVGGHFPITWGLIAYAFFRIIRGMIRTVRV